MSLSQDQDFSRVYILTPKIKLEDAQSQYTCSLAVVKRSQNLPNQNPIQLYPQFEEIKANCTKVLQDLGLKYYEDFQSYLNLLIFLNKGIQENNLEAVQQLLAQNQEIQNQGLTLFQHFLSWNEEIKDKGLELLQKFQDFNNQIKDQGLKMLKNFLDEIDLTKIDSLQQIKEKIQAELNSQQQGIFQEYEALGMIIALFPNDQVKEEAKKQLEKDYRFIPNFSLSLPERIASEAKTTTQIWPPENSGVALAHEKGIKGKGILVGVLDSGIDADHQEFCDRLINFRYISINPNPARRTTRDIRGFDPEGHGTHVCGIIAGQTIGIAPDVELYVASVIESETTSTSFARVINGLEWLLTEFSKDENKNKPAILNMSICFSLDKATDEIRTDQDFEDLLEKIRNGLQNLLSKANILPIVAIGNKEEGNCTYPGAFKEILGVGAVDFEGKVASFSSSGVIKGEGVTKPDLVGYGVDISSSVERNQLGKSVYKSYSGTSMAAPYVAGIAALYRCQHPSLKVDEIKQMILKNILKLEDQSSDRVGAGLVRFVL
ncbi:S8 family serine peptidase [Chroococcus sp. FPU101]|uniref:S8 family peptidase n=1 Tax=Chroococcus sp. FPU101 TaxID=1974212 RepID=UPI001A8DDF07|nr:S8 family serine peptidase [Chroococcus sp. FPU101]GFE69525.1 hypothetical protein CFPU101_21350 [Chroococcus sp. FPU101]